MSLQLSDYMKRDKYESSVVDEKDNKPCINNEALELNGEDIDIEKKYHFTVNKEHLSVFKLAGEPYIHVFLKIMAYYLYKSLYQSLQIDPPVYRKYKADLMALDYSNEPSCWLECFERDYTKIEYICKHIHVEEFILFEMADDIKPYLNELKNKIHYKYHHLITVINFVPELIYYIDPEEVVLIQDWYEVLELQDN
jgi:hypothetical protein